MEQRRERAMQSTPSLLNRVESGVVGEKLLRLLRAFFPSRIPIPGCCGFSFPFKLERLFARFRHAAIGSGFVAHFLGALGSAKVEMKTKCQKLS